MVQAVAGARWIDALFTDACRARAVLSESNDGKGEIQCVCFTILYCMISRAKILPSIFFLVFVVRRKSYPTRSCPKLFEVGCSKLSKVVQSWLFEVVRRKRELIRQSQKKRKRKRELIRQSTNSACETSASVACSLGRLALRTDFGRVTLTEIILELVDDERAADDGVGAGQRDLRIGNGELATGGGGLDVAEITGVTSGIRRRAVVHAVRVEVRAGGHAAVGGVAELVHVQAVLTRGQAGDGTDDGGRAVTLLGELEHARDTGGTGEDDDSLLFGGDDGENSRASRRGSDGAARDNKGDPTSGVSPRGSNR